MSWGKGGHCLFAEKRGKDGQKSLTDSHLTSCTEYCVVLPTTVWPFLRLRLVHNQGNDDYHVLASAGSLGSVSK